MPDTDRDREAVIAFARAVQEAQARGEPQHPADREQEHLERSRSLPRQEQFETPDQRLERFRQKGLRSDAESPPADIELDDDGKDITPKQPLSWSNVGQRMAEGIAPKIEHTPERDAAVAYSIEKAKDAQKAVDSVAVPAYHGVKRVEKHFVGQGAWNILDDLLRMQDDARHPKPRDITSYERHDENDDTVVRYNRKDIERADAERERVKRAIENAKNSPESK